MNTDPIFQEAGIIIFITLITGTFGGRFDPLPSELRSVISSNHLGEGPPIFHEYHALLPNFRGDYGIKSKIIKAVGKDPLYTGSDTLIVPLYIPEGSIPLRIYDRTARSGKPSTSNSFRFLGGPSPSLPGESSRVSINRPIIRRIGSPHRRGHVTIRKIPTPPPSFIRPWMKRRHGVSSTKPPDNVEEVKLSKILSHVADFHKQIERSRHNGSNSKISANLNPETKETSVARQKVTKLDTTGSSSTVRKIVSVKKNNGDGNMEKGKPTASYDSLSSTRPTIAPIRKIKKVISNASSKSIDEVLTEKKNIKRTINVRTSPDIKRRRIRPQPAKKGVSPTHDGTSTTTSVPEFKKLSHSQQKEIDATARLLLLSNPHTPLGKAIRRNTKIRLPVWPRINKSVLPKSSQTRKETEHHKSKSIIDRVLSSAGNRTSKNETSETSTTNTKDISALSHIDSKESSSNITQESIHTFEPVKLFHKKVNVNTTSIKGETRNRKEAIKSKSIESKGKDDRLKLSSRVKEPKHIHSSTLVPISDDITKEVDEKLKEGFQSGISQKVTNYITTSTPKMSWPLITNRKRKRKRKPYGEIIRRFNIPSKNFSKVIFHPSSPITTPKLKTAQDIVLEKLSSLMTASAESGAQSLEEIARDIEIINEELSALGIHIIDAEFDGHKLKLNQPHITVAQKQAASYKNFYPGHIRIPPNAKLSSANVSSNVRAVYPPHFNETVNNRTSVRVSSSEAAFFPHQLEAPDTSADSWRPVVTVKPVFSKENGSNFLPVTTSRYNVETSRTKSTTFSTVKKFTDKIAQNIAIIDNANHSILDSSHISRDESKMIYPTSHFRPTIKASDKQYAHHDGYQFPSTRVNVNAPNLEFSDLSNKELYIVEYLLNEEDLGVNLSKQYSDIGANKPPTPTIRTAFTTNLKIKDNISEYYADMAENERSDIENMDNTRIQNEVILVELSSSATSKKTENSSSYLYFLSLIGLLPLFGVMFILYSRRYKPIKKSLPEREEKSEGHTPPITHVRSSTHAGTLDALPAYVFEKSDNRNSPWELPRSKLRITSVIGEGNFGVVWKAEARNLCDWEVGGGPTVLVAVKGVKDNAGQKEKADLLRELSIMQHLGQHSNIVTLLGCCTSHEPFYLVMEYVMFGKLLTFLRENRSKNNYFNFSSDTEHLTSKDLCRFAYQITNGCEYLQAKGIIHRDLAARNILVDHNKTCKIADFGLARSIKDTDSDIYEQKSKGPLPIRWMALESLYMNIFTHKSDVWSFGILCWEIVTLGSTPYPGISAREVMRRVREGYRLERPDHCRGEFYDIVASCWFQDLNIRPSFASVKAKLRSLLDMKSGWLDLELFQESTYYSMHENNEERL